MKKRVYLLLGGIQSVDWPLTSRGMLVLPGMIGALAETKTYPWADYMVVEREILAHQDDWIGIVGFSGGGAHATWIANGYYETFENRARVGKRGPKPKIDLMVLYDPSPKSGCVDLFDTKVKRCVLYWNQWPLMLGLGGGKPKGPQVEVVPIAMQHLLVQTSARLHQRTVAEIARG